MFRKRVRRLLYRIGNICYEEVLMMRQVKVIKTSSSKTMEDRINETIQNLNGEFVDIKLTGAYDGSSERFLAIIIYEKNE